MAARFQVSALCLAAWIGWSFSAPTTGCANGEDIDPNNFVPAGGLKGAGGQSETTGTAGSMQSLPAGGSSGTSEPTTGSGGSDGQGGSTGAGGSGSVTDSGTPGSGGSGGQSGSTGTAGTGNMPMDAAVIPPDAPLAKGIVVFYKSAANSTNTKDPIWFYLNIVNNGTTAVPLSALKVRYYFMDELNGVGVKACYDSNTSTYPGGQNYNGFTKMTTETAAMMPMVTGANSYLEITTSNTDQLAVGSAWNLQCAYSAPAGQPQDQSNDYSANLPQTTYAQTTKIVVLQGTTLVAGNVPK
jgi:Cellulose binding domain